MPETEDEEYVKILFRYYSNVLEQEVVETMWATVVDQEKGLYKLDSIPFYGPMVASGDIFHAEYDEDEERLTYRNTIEDSGNSVVQVVRMDDSIEINDIRSIFEAMGCPSERVNDGYFSIEIPADTDYTPVRAKLDELLEQGTIAYAEPCLSERHAYESE